MKTKVLHFNIPQGKALLVSANKHAHVFARGTGKTNGVMAPRLTRLANGMPRSQNGIVGATYQQLLVRTLPPMIEGWERLGYKRDVHFIIGREPDKKWKKMWNWEGPRVKPLDSKHAIYWHNGTCFILISQDRIGSSNGLSLVSINGDEAKLLNKERLDDEVMPTLRGDRSHFGKHPLYRSEMYLTDRPTHKSGYWIYDFAERMDEEQIALIMQLQIRADLLRYAAMKNSGQKAADYLRRAQHISRKLDKLRMGSVYYSEASAKENIDVLGPEYFEDMQKALSDLKYRVSILNEKITKMEGGFYGNLDPKIHADDWKNYDYILGFDDPLAQEVQSINWKHDAGFIRSQPLDMAMDYGSDINCLVIGQFNERAYEYRALNSFYVLHPQLTEDVVHKFSDYFEGYPNRQINYYYDHTAISGIGTTEFTYASKVVAILRQRGWEVNELYVGKAPTHDRKYELIGMMLKESDPRLPKFRYSRTNCQQLEESMLGAGVTKGRNGFQKDKSSEKDPNIPPEDATHLSDAIDTLLFFRFHERLQESSSFIPSSQA